MTILLIDDDLDDADFFAIASTEMACPFDVISFSDCDEALSHVQTINLKPDYIFVDLVLPRTDGRKCLQSIRAINALQHVPVIMFISTRLLLDEQDLKTQGANILVQKPSSIHELKTLLTETFSTWPAGDSTMRQV